MIVPDVNLLIHAYDRDSPLHPQAREWWESSMNDPAPVGLAWVAILGFIRISTHRSILENPLPVETASDHARAWLAQPQVTVLHPGNRHAEVLFHLFEQAGTAGNLTTDAHLAALAIEYQAVLHTTDADFSRFSGLRRKNPLKA